MMRPNLNPRNLILIAAATIASGAQAQSDAKRLSINSVTASGAGCPNESFATYISEDAQAFTLSFDQYSVELSAGRDRTARKSCEVSLEMRVAPGWSFALIQADARGYAGIDAGIAGTMRMFSRQDRRPYLPMSQTQLKGDYFDDYLTTGKLKLSAYQWSSCSPGAKKVQIFTDLNLQRIASKNIAYADLSLAAVDAASAVESLISLVRDLGHAKSSMSRSARHLHDALKRLNASSDAARPKARIRSESLVVLSWWKHLQTAAKHDRHLHNNTEIKDSLGAMGSLFDAIDGLSQGENPNAAGLMTVDTLDGLVTQKYAVAWKRCS